MVEVLLGLPKADQLMDRIFADAQTRHAPELLDVEVTQVLRRYERNGGMSSARALQALSDLADFPIVRYAHAPLLERAWQLRRNVTAYDAVYIALAEALGAVLLTCDKALVGIPGVRARVQLC